MRQISTCDSSNQRSGWCLATSGQKMRILDLKHEVNELSGQIGHLPRYSSAELQDGTEN